MTAALLALAALVAASPAAAQFRPYGASLREGNFIEPPRGIRQAIDDAQAAIAAGQYSEAVVTLGDLLARDAVVDADADLAGQDFFLETEAPEGPLDRSLMREAEVVLGRLPAAGMDIYELRYGAKAEQMLTDATAAGDQRQLREISRRYFHTRAGYRATLLMGLMELSEGRPVAASSILGRLAEQPRAREQFGDALLVRLAQAQALAARPEQATANLRTAAEGGLDAQIASAQIASAPVPAPDEGQESQWLADRFGTLRQDRPSPPDATWVAEGGAAGRGSGSGSLPLSGIRWELPTTVGQHQRKTLTDFIDANQGDVAPPTWQPIVIGNQLLMRTTERLMAVDFETGKRVWEYPWSNPPEAVEEDIFASDQMGNADAAHELLVQRVWNDLPYGRITSDGKRVFMLKDLGELETASISGMGIGGIRVVRPADTGTNTLVALELATEGKLLWTRGQGGNEPVENGLAGAFFLGPPLPVEGLLYQMAEIAGDTYLLCLEPASGRELWRQQLLGNEGSSISSDALRRIGGATPAYSDGILVCTTSASAVVAMDLASRTLLWGNYFPLNDTNAMLQTTGRYRATPDQSVLMKKRWLQGRPTIVDGCVLITPVESDRLFGFDLLTGEPLWPPILRKDLRYLAGSRDGRFLLVGADGVQAYDLESGQPAWTSAVELPAGEHVAGTGLFGEGVYLLPTTGGEIIEIGLETGEILQRRDVHFPLGNLMAAGNSIISQDATSLSVAYAEAPIRGLVDQRLENDPNDRWAMIRRGELLLQEGQRAEAIEWLMRARAEDPRDEEVRVLLVDALLDSIRNGEQPDEATTELLDQLIELPPQRAELLRLKVDRAIGQGDPQAASESLAELSSIVLREQQLSRPNQLRMVETGAGGRVSIDAWIAAHLDQILQLCDAAQRQQVETVIAAEIDSHIAEAAGVKQRVVAQFGRSAVADQLRAILFDAALDDGYWVAAERLALDAIQAASEQDQSTRQLDWKRRLVELYVRAEFGPDAAKLAAELEAAEGEAAEGEAEASVSLDAATEEAIAAMTATHQWPAGVKMMARDDPMQTRTSQARFQPIDVVARRGETVNTWVPLVDRSGTIWVRDPMGIEHQVPFEPQREQGDLIQAAIDGGVMVLLMPHEIVAFDLLSMRTRPVDALLWRRPWLAQSGSRSVRSRGAQDFFDDNRRNYVITSDALGPDTSGIMRLGPIQGGRLFLLQGRDLIAIDVATNEEIWRASGFAPDGFVIAKEDLVAVVSGETGVHVRSALDGRPLRQEAWEPSERIYLAVGGHLLTTRNQPVTTDAETPQRVVRLRSPIDGKEVLQATLESPPGSRSIEAYARLIDGRHMVLLAAQGRLLIWDLLEGRSIADTPIEVGGALSGIHVLTWEDDFLVALVRRGDRNLDEKAAPTLHIQDGPDHVETDGPLVMVSRSDGQVRWTYDLDGPWGISKYQPGRSPLVVLTRSLPHYENRTGKPDRTMDLLAIDTRSGELAIKVDAMNVESNFVSIATDTKVLPERNLVDVSARRYGFTFEFVEEALPAEERILGAETILKQQEESAKSAQPLNLFGTQPPIPIR